MARAAPPPLPRRRCRLPPRAQRRSPPPLGRRSCLAFPRLLRQSRWLLRCLRQTLGEKEGMLPGGLGERLEGTGRGKAGGGESPRWRARRKDTSLGAPHPLCLRHRERLRSGLRGFGQARARVSASPGGSGLRSAGLGNFWERAWKGLLGCRFQMGRVMGRVGGVDACPRSPRKTCSP